MFWLGCEAKKAFQCIAAHCPAMHVYMHERGEGIAESLYYSGSKRCPVGEFLEAGKRRRSGDRARQAASPEVTDLRSESLALKECVADLTLENRLLEKSMTGAGEVEE